LDIYSVTVATIKLKSLSIPISINCAETNKSVKTLGLVDSGAGGMFIDQNYVRNSGFKIQKLDEPLIARNMDGTENKQGRITSFVDLLLEINGKTMNTRLMVTGLGKQRIILGFPWLNEHNPDINWKTGEFTWRLTKPEQKQSLKIKRYHKRRSLKIKRYHHPLERAKMLAQQAIVDEVDREEKLNRTRDWHG
jgi:hypothetical protein